MIMGETGTYAGECAIMPRSGRVAGAWKRQQGKSIENRGYPLICGESSLHSSCLAMILAIMSLSVTKSADNNARSLSDRHSDNLQATAER
ncbi:MAG: hypothetical protein PUB19_10325 [Lachnospiraceae bacterium]|nr:hypothetical protein [Lachnospiraceae bacterium]